MPKSSTFLFIIIIFFLLFSFASYQLLYKNISDNHKKNQEIVFYQIQKDTSSFLSKLLFKFSKEKEPLFEKHKEVLKYLEKNSFDVSLDEIYDLQTLILHIYNSFDPDLAQGVELNKLLKLIAQTRRASTKSIVDLP